jgi:hypothetical protein
MRSATWNDEIIKDSAASHRFERAKHGFDLKSHRKNAGRPDEFRRVQAHLAKAIGAGPPGILT